MNLTTIFNQLNIPMKTLYEIINLGKITKPLANLRPNTTLEYALDHDGKLIQIDYSISPKQKLTIALDGEKYIARIINTQIEKRIHYASAIISSSLSNAANKAGLTEKTIMDIVNIFSWDINFKKDIRPGDSFTVIYEDHYAGDTKIRDGKILAVRFSNRGKIHEAIRHTFQNGTSQYYSPAGRSLKPAFIRRPLKYTRISSPFKARRKHPILGIIRPHPGVDYAAPYGTPIKASGNGKISYLGRKGGYGRTIMIKHGRQYTTLYAHLSKYAKNIYRGKRVTKGDIIGYVGKSGLADGPHLHYEFWIKGKKVNPETVKLPMASSLTGIERTRFKSASKPLISQLALYDSAPKEDVQIT
ncbi:MAG: peptidoglycan DD-metalloendopeptidase family protein [Legionellales bacterium]|nr:peptidoglycan DD-metalloendopeptidase family protein [Legionellales bacterium]